MFICNLFMVEMTEPKKIVFRTGMQTPATANITEKITTFNLDIYLQISICIERTTSFIFFKYIFF